MVVVLHEEPNGQHEEVDVVEHQGVFIGVGCFLLEERDRVVTPVAKGVEVVRGVVSVVVAEAVTL